MKKRNYYVEGQTEKNLVNTIKGEHIVQGNVKIFDFWEEKYKKSHLRNLQAKEVIIIFDTDKHSTKSRFKEFKNNLTTLSSSRTVEKIILISQNKNLEDEIINSTKLQKILNFYNVESIDKHKSKFSKDQKLNKSLIKHDFDFEKMWKIKLIEENNFNDNKIVCGKEHIIIDTRK